MGCICSETILSGQYDVLRNRGKPHVRKRSRHDDRPLRNDDQAFYTAVRNQATPTYILSMHYSEASANCWRSSRTSFYPLTTGFS